MEKSHMDTIIYRNKGAKLGIVLGAVMIVLTILPLYFFASTSSFLVVFIGPVVIGILLPLAVAVFFTLKLRRMLGGYWDFKQALTGVFMMLFVASIILSVTSFVFEKYIQPDMKERYVRNLANNTIEFMESQGSDAEQIDAQIAKIDEELENVGKGAKVSTMLGGLGISVIFIFLVSIIFAAIFKRDRPVFYSAADNPQEDKDAGPY